MDRKEEAIGDFFRAIQMAFNNAAYFRGHPYFGKTVELFKEKLDALLLFCNPVVLEVLPTKIIFDNRTWEKNPLYEAIAQHLHVRKIEKVTISGGYRFEELNHFLSIISLPAREIEQQGNVNTLLAGQCPSFTVQALDYSGLLQKDDHKAGDAWVAILQAALKNNDTQKLTEYAQTFGSHLAHFDYRLLAQDHSVNHVFQEFFEYVKKHNKFDFDRCIKEMYDFLSAHGALLQESDYTLICELFKNVEVEDFARILSEEFLFKDRVDTLNFKFFCHLSGEDKQKSIVEVLFSDKEFRQKIHGNTRVIHNVQALLSPTTDKYISAVYRNTLTHFLQEITFGGTITFDHDLLESNYRFALLNLFIEERERSSLSLISRRIGLEVKKALETNDNGYVQLLCSALAQQEKENPACADVFREINDAFGDSAEKSLWEQAPLGTSCVLERIDVQRFSAAYFLDKFFKEQIVSSAALTYFFKMHAQEVPTFYARLKEHMQDVEFITRLIETAAAMEPPLSVTILQNVYAQSNEFLRREILKAMGNLTDIDAHFLRGLLRTERGQLKKDALALIARDADSLREALGELLLIPNPWGFQDEKVLENIELVADLRLQQAKDNLQVVLKRAPIWSFRLKKRIQRILTLWNS